MRRIVWVIVLTVLLLGLVALVIFALGFRQQASEEMKREVERSQELNRRFR